MRGIIRKLVYFAEVYGQTILLRRYSGPHRRWVAYFEYAEVKDDPILRSVAGEGADPDRAMVDYAKKIAGKLLVFHAGSETGRREFNVPEGLGTEDDGAVGTVSVGT